MGRLCNTIIAGLFVLTCSAQHITIELDGKRDSIPLRSIINRVGEIKMDHLRFKLVVWGSYNGKAKHLVVRSKGGEFSTSLPIKQKDGVLVKFRTRLRKIPVIIKEVQLKQKQ